MWPRTAGPATAGWLRWALIADADFGLRRCRTRIGKGEDLVGALVKMVGDFTRGHSDGTDRDGGEGQPATSGDLVAAARLYPSHRCARSVRRVTQPSV